MIFENVRFLFDGMIAIKLESPDVLCDLHNDGQFTGFQFDVLVHRLTLCWRMRTGVRLDLLFDEVTVLELSPRDPEMPLSEDETIEGFGRMDSFDDFSVWCTSGSIDSWSPWGTADVAHLSFRFRGGQVIRVGAAKVTAALSERP